MWGQYCFLKNKLVPLVPARSCPKPLPHCCWSTARYPSVIFVVWLSLRAWSIHSPIGPIDRVVFDSLSLSYSSVILLRFQQRVDFNQQPWSPTALKIFLLSQTLRLAVVEEFLMPRKGLVVRFHDYFLSYLSVFCKGNSRHHIPFDKLPTSVVFIFFILDLKS